MDLLTMIIYFLVKDFDVDQSIFLGWYHFNIIIMGLSTILSLGLPIIIDLELPMILDLVLPISIDLEFLIFIDLKGYVHQ